MALRPFCRSFFLIIIMILTTTIMVHAQDWPTPAPRWCLPKAGSTEQALLAGLNWACSPSGGAADCSAIQPGGLCYEPNTIFDHTSYAFNQYYQKQHQISAACDFSTTAVISFNNPSHGACRFDPD